MADTLVNMHHHRIKYPWQAKRAEEFGVPSQAFGRRPSSPEIEVKQSAFPGPESQAPADQRASGEKEKESLDWKDAGRERHRDHEPAAGAVAEHFPEVISPTGRRRRCWRDLGRSRCWR